MVKVVVNIEGLIVLRMNCIVPHAICANLSLNIEKIRCFEAASAGDKVPLMSGSATFALKCVF